MEWNLLFFLGVVLIQCWRLVLHRRVVDMACQSISGTRGRCQHIWYFTVKKIKRLIPVEAPKTPQPDKISMAHTIFGNDPTSFLQIGQIFCPRCFPDVPGTMLRGFVGVCSPYFTRMKNAPFSSWGRKRKSSQSPISQILSAQLWLRQIFGIFPLRWWLFVTKVGHFQVISIWEFWKMNSSSLHTCWYHSYYHHFRKHYTHFFFGS